jgi:exopolysaccharide biosynthesis polyprenyl glycosylphosphotransferase
MSELPLTPSPDSTAAAVVGLERAVARPHPHVETHPRRDGWRALRVAGDVAGLAAAPAVVALAIAPGASLPWIAGLVLAMLVSLGVHEASRMRLRVRPAEEVALVGKVTALTSLAVAGLVLLVGDSAELEPVVETGLVAAGLLGVSRGGLALGQGAVRRHRGPVRRTLIVGAGQVGRLTAERLLANPTLGLRPVGFLDKEPLDTVVRGERLPVFGASWDLERTVEDQGIDVVVVAFSTAPNHVPLSIVRRCWEMGLSVILIPRLFEVQGTRAFSEHIGGLPLVTLNPANPRGWELKVKYAVDRAVALLLLLTISPLLGAISLAILVTMDRPLLFRQARMGRDGHVFDMLKFRTMWGAPDSQGENDAEWRAETLAAHANGNGNGAVPHADGNGTASRNGNADAGTNGNRAVDRRTPLGRFLRRYSLDEFPQLLNVLRGDMALVGPRPERVAYADEFQDAVYRYRDRARIKPGLTGWAQVHGLRGETSLADRVEWDNFYIENWSPWLDAKILVLTVASMAEAPTEG